MVERVAQLEDELRLLKTELELTKNSANREGWQTLDNMPDGTVFHTVRDMKTGTLKIVRVGGTWEKIMGVSVEETLADTNNVFKNIEKNDLKMLIHQLNEALDPLKKLDIEVRYHNPKNNSKYWIQIFSYPRREGDFVVADGFIFDVNRRKETEQKLKAEKERMETISNNIPDGTLYSFELNTETGGMYYTYLGDKWETITGIAADVAISDINTVFAMVHPEDVPKIMQEIDNSAQTMTNSYSEFRMTVNGKTRWIQMLSHPHSNENLVIWDGIIVDITPRKEDEFELKSEKDRLQALGDNIPGGTLYQFVRDTRTGQMRMSYVSATWEAVTNVPANIAMSDISQVFDLVHPDDLTDLICSIDDSARTMTDHYKEFRLGGNWIHIVSHPHREGKNIIWDGIMTNITARKEIEHELAAEKDRLQIMGDNLPDSSLFQFVRDIRTRQMRLSYVSATWEIITGINADIALNDVSKVFSTIPSDDLPVFLQHLDDSARAMSNFKYEIRFGERWMYIVARPRREEKQVIWDGIITDISERKKNETELYQYREKLEFLVKQATEELNVTNEEMQATNEELYATNEELHSKNNQLADEMNARTEVMKLLEESENKMSNFISQSFEGITFINNEGRIIEWNPMQEIITGIRSEDAIGEYAWELYRKLIPAENAENMVSIFKNKIMSFFASDNKRKKNTDTSEFEFSIPGRNKQHIILVSFIIKTKDKCYLGQIVRDVTEERLKDAELEQYRSHLEQMVEKQTEELRENQESLVSLNRRQAILIDVLQIMQSNENVSEAMNLTIAEIGKFIGVSRVNVFEKSVDKKNIRNTYEWCNEGVKSYINTMENMSAEAGKFMFDVFKIGGYICTSEIDMLPDELAEMLTEKGVKSIVAFPLTLYGVNYGFVDFIECETSREWSKNEVELLKSLSQIISGAASRHHSEITLRQSEELYRQLTAASPDAIVMCNNDANIRYISPKAFEIFKIENNADIDNMRVLQYVHSTEHCQITEMFEKLETDNLCFIPQLMLIRSDNSEFIGEISAAAIKEEAGSANFSVIMVIRDITRRKMDEMELIRAKEKAEESERLKSAFLANMSHEIRTPLNGIVGFLRFLGTENLSPQRRQEYMNVINSSSQQLTKIIDDIIDIAKLEAKQMTMCPIPVDVNELMNDMWVFFETFIQSKNKDRVSLILDDSGFIDKCFIYVDAVRLRQVLTNLIGNAVKYTEKGYIRFGYRRSMPDELEFVVEDSGIGLPANQKEVIFERFRQAEIGNARQLYGGTGLGLTISRNLIHLKGGKMWVESTEGYGSSFYFTIPYLPVMPDETHIFNEITQNKETDKKLFAGKTVLIVEPKTLKFKYYERIIMATGATVINAETLQEWFSAVVQNSAIDFVFADAALFDHEDFNNIRRIRNARSNLPIALIISEKREKYMHLFRHKLCDKIVEIPVSYGEIVEIMKEYVK